MKENLTIGKKIWQIAKNQRFTKVDFAKKIDISRQTLDNWINGTYAPDTGELIKICKILNISLAEFDENVKNVSRGNPESNAQIHASSDELIDALREVSKWKEKYIEMSEEKEKEILQLQKELEIAKNFTGHTSTQTKLKSKDKIN